MALNMGTGESIETLRRRLECAAGEARRAAPQLSVRSLVARYMAEAKRRYDPRPGGTSNELSNLDLALAPLLALYGAEPPEAFGSLQLRAVQLLLVERGLCCATINARLGRIKRVFRWGVAMNWVPPAQISALESVAPVRPPEAPGSRRVEAVRPEVVERTLLWLDGRGTRRALTLAAMIRVQMLTGMRPGELVGMCSEHIHRDGAPQAPATEGETWGARPGAACAVYLPPRHKTAWRGRKREILLGPRAMAAILPYLRPSGALFRSRLGLPYTVNSYQQSLRRASDRAGVVRWTANQLRHLAATLADERAGAETACEILGHGDLRTTERYLSRRRLRAADYAERYG